MQVIVFVVIFIFILYFLFRNKSKYIADYISNKESFSEENNPKKKENHVSVPNTEPVIDKNIKRLSDKWLDNKVKEIIEYKSVINLLSETPINQIGYSKLLNCFEWQFKRFKVLVRDNFICQGCGKVDNRHHVHHKYYLKGALPWEIDDTALVSLCKSCHFNLHERESIYVYEKVGTQLKLANYPNTKCWKCYGTGYLRQFTHVENGICFACFGDVISKTIFSNRLSEISLNPTLYNHERMESDFLNYIVSIPVDFYINSIHDKLYSESQSEIDDFFSPDNEIIYKRGENELLDFLLVQDYENDKKINEQRKFGEEECDDLPF
jgi:5-methylcytosine-specific restriction endonuclease McrA